MSRRTFAGIILLLGILVAVSPMKCAEPGNVCALRSAVVADTADAADTEEQRVGNRGLK